MRIIHIITIGCLAFFPAGRLFAADNYDAQAILAKIEARAMQKEKALQSLRYQADSVTIIKDAAGKQIKEIASQRQIVMKDNQAVNHYQSMSIDGRQLSEKEMAAELAKSRSEEGKSPFAPGEMAKYIFTIAGETQIDGQTVWVVEFKPKNMVKGFVIGKGYVQQQDYELVKLEFSPVKLESVIKHLNMVMNFQKQQGYWLPSDFAMDMQVKVVFVVTLADQQIQVKEKYGEYEL